MEDYTELDALQDDLSEAHRAIQHLTEQLSAMRAARDRVMNENAELKRQNKSLTSRLRAIRRDS